MFETESGGEGRHPPTGASVGPPNARVRDDDLPPHEGLHYVAKLFKALSILLVFMLIAEVFLGLRQDGTSALGPLVLESARLFVFAGAIWAAGDFAVLFVESNHDLRAIRILIGRLNSNVEKISAGRTPDQADNASSGGTTRPESERRAAS